MNGKECGSYPDNNPKSAIGAKKVPMHLVPPSAKYFLALALEDGAKKYGPYNWRDAPISISVYKAALERHTDAFWDGEDNAPDSGIHHMAHAMACCALLLDAMTVNCLNDDRPTKGAVPKLQANYLENDKRDNLSNAVSEKCRTPSECMKAARKHVIDELAVEAQLLGFYDDVNVPPPPEYDPRDVAFTRKSIAPTHDYTVSLRDIGIGDVPHESCATADTAYLARFGPNHD